MLVVVGHLCLPVLLPPTPLLRADSGPKGLVLLHALSLTGVPAQEVAHRWLFNWIERVQFPLPT